MRLNLPPEIAFLPLASEHGLSPFRLGFKNPSNRRHQPFPFCRFLHQLLASGKRQRIEPLFAIVRRDFPPKSTQNMARFILRCSDWMVRAIPWPCCDPKIKVRKMSIADVPGGFAS
jgi:hypothetical protein